MRPAARIVRGQRVEGAKVVRARELRRDLTSAENLLWQALRRSQLKGRHFRRQQVIRGFIVDFYCHSAGIVVEVDGPAHDGNVDYDSERGEVLASLGLHEVRFTNEEVEGDLPGVLRRIGETCGQGQGPEAGLE